MNFRISKMSPNAVYQKRAKSRSEKKKSENVVWRAKSEKSNEVAATQPTRDKQQNECEVTRVIFRDLLRFARVQKQTRCAFVGVHAPSLALRNFARRIEFIFLAHNKLPKSRSGATKADTCW